MNYRCETDNNDPTILPRLSISNTTTSDAVIIQSNLSFSTILYCFCNATMAEQMDVVNSDTYYFKRLDPELY